MYQNKPAIVVVAYNRPRSLERLLVSLSKAYYPVKNITLIISIDYAQNNKDVLQIAKDFSWNFGVKEVRYQENNLGLRKHVLKCGDLSIDYGSVIVLEDDLYVSPNFYDYTCQALDFSGGKKYLGGISLYKHEFNVCTYKNFRPITDGYDNWYFQFASSWGQAWSADHWRGFREWYSKDHKLTDNLAIPSYVRSWSEKSWLKYNTAYLIDENLFFLYPKTSLTTNFSDVGTHVGDASTAFQVPLLCANYVNYNFSDIEVSDSVYDAFFENLKIHKCLNVSEEQLTVDLYGHKEEYLGNLLLTSKVLKYKVEKSYGSFLKPIDANILFDISGSDLFLYDLKQVGVNTKKSNNLKSIFYNIKYISLKDSYQVFKYLSKKRLKYLAKKIFNI